METEREIVVSERRIDAAAAPAFKQEMATQLSDRPTRVLLNMTDVEFVDSTGLGVLVSLLKQMGEGGKIAVFGAAPSVRRLFQITRLDSLFALCESSDAAWAILRG